MGGLPKANDQDIGYFNLNLSPSQLDEVATKLNLPNNFKQQLAGGGTYPPRDDEEIKVTFKGKYVRITYQNGQAQSIKPP